MFVGSLAVAFGAPPPDTVAVFVTVSGDGAVTATVNVIAG